MMESAQIIFSKSWKLSILIKSHNSEHLRLQMMLMVFSRILLKYLHHIQYLKVLCIIIISSNCQFNINLNHQYQLFYRKKSFLMTILSHGKRNHWKWPIPFIQFWGQCTSNVPQFIRISININVLLRSKFGESFVRVVVFGLSKFPGGQLVVDTGVTLRSDEENFVHVLDLWSSQVQNNTTPKL